MLKLCILGTLYSMVQDIFIEKWFINNNMYIKFVYFIKKICYKIIMIHAVY